MRSSLQSRGCRVRHGAAIAVLFSVAAFPMMARAQTIQWIRQFGTAGVNQARGMALDATGVYVVGGVSGALPAQSSAGGNDAYVRKYDANGNELWTRQFGSARSDDAYAVAVDSSGVYIVGRTDGALPGQTNAGGYDAFVRKYDAIGNEQWTRQFGSGTGPSVSIFDAAYGVAVNATGVYVAGTVSAALPGQLSLGGFDGFVRKYDANGVEAWTRQFGSSSHDRMFAAAVDSTGVYVAGDTGLTSTGFFDALVRKYDPNGTEQWIRQFGSGKQDDAYGVAVDGAGGVYVVGEAGGALAGQNSAGVEDAFVQKFDVIGTELWTRQFGTTGIERAYGVAADGTGIYVVGETSGTLPGQTGAGVDAFLRKYDPLGTDLGLLQFGSIDDESARGAALDATGVYVIGETGGTLPGQTLAGLSDAFAAKLSTTSPPCSYSISPTNRSFTTSSGSGTVSVSAPSGCSWTATSNTTSFVTILSGNVGSGNGIVSYFVTENTAAEHRTGTLSIAGLTYTVTQEGTRFCIYTIAPTSRSASGGGESGTVSVTTPSDCFWTSTSSAAFLTVTSGSTGNGNGTVGYTVAANPSPITRSATLTIGGQTFTVTQGGGTPPPPPPPSPAVNDGGVVSAASLAPSPAPVAPGSIAAVFGSNLNDGSSVLVSSFGTDGRLVTTLGGASVRINNIPAPMFYSTPVQLAIQIPTELAGLTSATIQVTVGTQTSQPRTVFLDAIAPGIFTVSRDGRGAAVALHQDGITLVTAQNPARPGEIVVLYGTGLGPLTPPLATGAPSAGNVTASTPAVIIDGLPGEIQFSGATSGLVGLNQINVRIPPTTRSAPDIPVVLSIGGRPSNSVTIAVSP